MIAFVGRQITYGIHCPSSLIGYSTVKARSRLVLEIDILGRRLTQSPIIALLIGQWESRDFTNFESFAHVSSHRRNNMQSGLYICAKANFQMKLFLNPRGAWLAESVKKIKYKRKDKSACMQYVLSHGKLYAAHGLHFACHATLRQHRVQVQAAPTSKFIFTVEIVL